MLSLDWSNIQTIYIGSKVYKMRRWNRLWARVMCLKFNQLCWTLSPVLHQGILNTDDAWDVGHYVKYRLSFTFLISSVAKKSNGDLLQYCDIWQETEATPSCRWAMPESQVWVYLVAKSLGWLCQACRELFPWLKTWWASEYGGSQAEVLWEPLFPGEPGMWQAIVALMTYNVELRRAMCQKPKNHLWSSWLPWNSRWHEVSLEWRILLMAPKEMLDEF